MQKTNKYKNIYIDYTNVFSYSHVLYIFNVTLFYYFILLIIVFFKKQNNELFSLFHKITVCTNHASQKNKDQN